MSLESIQQYPSCRFNLSSAQRSQCQAEAVPAHSNGVLRVDHVVIRSTRPVATDESLKALGLSVQRVRTDIYPQTRQSFVAGKGGGGVVLEVIGPVDEDLGSPPEESVWGLALDVHDIDALYAKLGPELLTKPRPAVQQGRRICAVKGGGGAQGAPPSLAIAFISPSPRAPQAPPAPGWRSSAL